MSAAFRIAVCWFAAAPALLFVPLHAMDPIQYTLRFPAPATHYAEVEAEYPVGGRESVDLMMAVWTPGSYLIRDYAGRVEQVRAFDSAGRELPIVKSRKNRWSVKTGGVKTGGAESIKLTYRVYCHEMSVRTNWVERDFAILNGAPTFITLLDPETGRPAVTEHRVRVELAETWPRVHSALAASGGDFIAENFDELVDSPILAGDLAIDRFDAGGAEHFLVHLGDSSLFDRERARDDLKKLVEEQQRFWDAVPYASYSFLNAITEGRGGLEHKRSTLVMASRWATRTPKAYGRWLKLISHEFFHTWNVKRLRPAALGPFDYERENHTRSLWVAEGLTSYYEAVLPRRAGLMSDKEFLESLSEDIRSVQTTPGRLVDAVTEASYDAWIKLYKRHENSANSSISYYSKGAVVGFLLDAEIRRRSAGKRSLDDALRAAWDRYSGERGFTEEEFRALLSETAGEDLSAWLEQALDRGEELDFERALQWFGLRFKAPEEKEEDSPAWLGAKVESREGRLVVSVVKRTTPAHEAGVQVDDEILAIDDYRIGTDALDKRLDQYHPGDEVALLVARRGRLTALRVTLGEKPTETWTLEVDPEAEEEAAARRQYWLER